jgi:catechol 2,3-dioxygenase-like lactoylglutathione lyase family enzyme
MQATWPIIAVESVRDSVAWYTRLLGADETHPGASVFNQVVAADGTILLCLHHWGPSGARGDKEWPTLTVRREGSENGLLLWFLVDDFDEAWDRARDLGRTVESPNTDNGTHLRAFMLRDPDGYYVVVNEAASGG